MPNVGSIVFFHCSPETRRPAVVIARRSEELLDVLVLLTPDDAFELGVAEPLFVQGELDACAAYRREVTRGDVVGQWTPSPPALEEPTPSGG